MARDDLDQGLEHRLCLGVDPVEILEEHGDWLETTLLKEQQLNRFQRPPLPLGGIERLPLRIVERHVEERKDGRWVLHRLTQDETATTQLELVWRSIARDPRVECDARVLRKLRLVPVEELCRAGLDLDRLGINRPSAAGPLPRARRKER